METIKFTNELGEEVDENDINNLEYYSKVFYRDDKPFKKETYKLGKHITESFYVTSKDDIEEKLIIKPDLSFVYTYYQNNYKVVEYLNFKDSVLTEKTSFIYNETNDYICYAKYNTRNGILSVNMIEKYIYKDGKKIYSIEYNDDGTCFLVTNEQSYQSDIYGWSIKEAFWKGLEYYKTAEPIIPEK